jgi:hypothetical protein
VQPVKEAHDLPSIQEVLFDLHAKPSPLNKKYACA